MSEVDSAHMLSYDESIHPLDSVHESLYYESQLITLEENNKINSSVNHNAMNNNYNDEETSKLSNNSAYNDLKENTNQLLSVSLNDVNLFDDVSSITHDEISNNELTGFFNSIEGFTQSDAVKYSNKFTDFGFKTPTLIQMYVYKQNHLSKMIELFDNDPIILECFLNNFYSDHQDFITQCIEKNLPINSNLDKVYQKEIANEDSIKLLVDAVANNQSDIVNELFKRYQYIIYDIKDKCGEDLLSISFSNKYFDIINILKNYPIDYNIVSHSKVNAIIWFCLKGDYNLFKQLINNDSSLLKSTNEINQLLIHYAAIGGDFDIFKHIVDIDKNNIYKLDFSNQLPLHYASQYGNYGIFRFILNFDNKMIYNPDKFKQLPIHYAIQFGYNDLLVYILDMDNNMINIPGDCNRSPLILSIIYNKVAIVRYLIKVDNINKEHKDMYGKSALNYAEENNYTELIKLLSC